MIEPCFFARADFEGIYEVAVGEVVGLRTGAGFPGAAVRVFAATACGIVTDLVGVFCLCGCKPDAERDERREGEDTMEHCDVGSLN